MLRRRYRLNERPLEPDRPLSHDLAPRLALSKAEKKTTFKNPSRFGLRFDGFHRADVLSC